MMARPKLRAVKGTDAFSMAPSRTCRCQSSGFLMVIRSGALTVLRASAADRRRRGREGLGRRLVDHGAGEIGDARKAALFAPFLELFDDGDHCRRVAEG